MKPKYRTTEEFEADQNIARTIMHYTLPFPYVCVSNSTPSMINTIPDALCGAPLLCGMSPDELADDGMCGMWIQAEYIWTHDAQNLGLNVLIPTQEQKEKMDRFRVLDDDNIVYAEGLLNPELEPTGMMPLEYAAVDSGCAHIEYLKNGKWERLV